MFRRNRADTSDSVVQEKPPLTPDINEEKDDVVVPALTDDQPVTSRLRSLPQRGIRALQPTIVRLELLPKQGIRAVRSARKTRIGYACVGFFLIILWLVITVSFAQDEVKSQKKNYNSVKRTASGSKNDNLDQLWVLEGSLVSFTTDTRTLTVSWTPKILLGGDFLGFGTSDETTFEIGVFRDEKMVLEWNQTLIANLTQEGYNPPYYRIDNDTALPIAVVGNDPWDNFDTDIEFGQAEPDSAWHEPLFGFPFDRWAGSIIFTANFLDLATEYKTPVSFGVEWDSVDLVDSIINWRIAFTTNNTCTDLQDGILTWIPGPSCQMEIDFTARRTGLVVFACVVAVIVNWTSTIFIFIMTCEGVVMRRFRVIEGPQLLAVCFTALFALPSVRSILPGAPDFGCLNLIGIVPNVIIISICTTMVAIATLRNLIDNNNSDDAKEDAREEAANKA